MRIVDFYPLKGTYQPGETVVFQADLSAEAEGDARIQLTPIHLDQPLAQRSFPVALSVKEQSARISWMPPPQAPRAYGITAQLISSQGEVLDTARTACDVLPDWTIFPRYGFLSDFFPGRGDLEAAFRALARFHINGLQFYDWQFRHERLVAPEPKYEDPLGRTLSLDTVRRFAESAGRYGMAAMPYLAVYAASLPFWRAHPDWALYDERGEALKFMDFLGLMDPTPGGPWEAHLRAECRRALEVLPFDGLHVDQYGEPKVGFRASGERVDLPGAFTAFIQALKSEHPDKTVVFNAVENWPIETLARSLQDFNYIEVWPPQTHYLDLVEIVANARNLSERKPVVIALYLPADRLANIRLADALIYSSGGSRIELGETGRLLTDPYFPNHQPLPPEALVVLRRYADFAVRYGELIGPYAGSDPGVELSLPQGVWGAVRSSPGWRAVSLVNLRGLADPRWDEDHAAPHPQTGPVIRLKAPGEVRQVWWASPDRGEVDLTPAAVQMEGKDLQIRLPYLDIWGMVALALDRELSRA